MHMIRILSYSRDFSSFSKKKTKLFQESIQTCQKAERSIKSIIFNNKKLCSIRSFKIRNHKYSLKKLVSKRGTNTFTAQPTKLLPASTLWYMTTSRSLTVTVGAAFVTKPCSRCTATGARLVGSTPQQMETQNFGTNTQGILLLELFQS